MPMPQGDKWKEIKAKIAPPTQKVNKFHRDTFWRYVSERFQIHQRRYVEEKEFPWTDDSILRDYHFTSFRCIIAFDFIINTINIKIGSVSSST